MKSVSMTKTKQKTRIDCLAIPQSHSSPQKNHQIYKTVSYSWLTGKYKGDFWSLNVQSLSVFLFPKKLQKQWMISVLHSHFPLARSAKHKEANTAKMKMKFLNIAFFKPQNKNLKCIRGLFLKQHGSGALGAVQRVRCI